MVKTPEARSGLPYELRGKRVWVAGHRGMVGAALVRRLASEGCELLLKTFAEVADAAECAPAMLELSQSAKTPRIAREWLEKRVATSVRRAVEIHFARRNAVRVAAR